MFESIKKTLLLFLIGLSGLIFLPVFAPGLDALSIAQYLGFVGMQLVWWQVVLGSRVLSRYISGDLFFVKNIHKYLGRYGFILVMLHPTIMLLAYGISLFFPPSFDYGDQFVLGKTLGQIGLSFLILTWFVSVFLRTRISWRNWKRIHLIPYMALPLLFTHSLLIGSHLQSDTFFKSWLIFLIISFLLIVVTRLVDWSGELKLKYRLAAKTKVANGVTRFDFIPLGSSMKPRPGQFAYLQMKRFGEVHPFTISHFDKTTGQISQSIKAVGPYSSALQDLEVGDRVFLEGTYGVFTAGISGKQRPVVAVAGGIGITPFIRWLENKQIDYVFYGAQTEADLAYKNVIRQSGAKILNVLSNQQRNGFASGYITLDLIKSKLEKSLANYDYYICGPPVMMEKITNDLAAYNVPKSQIHSERFSL